MNTKRSFRSSFLCALALLAACLGTPVHARAASPGTSTEPPAGPLPFIQDDYAKALALARTQEAPLFIEFWAPW